MRLTQKKQCDKGNEEWLKQRKRFKPKVLFEYEKLPSSTMCFGVHVAVTSNELHDLVQMSITFLNYHWVIGIMHRKGWYWRSEKAH